MDTFQISFHLAGVYTGQATQAEGNVKASRLSAQSFICGMG